MQSLGTETLKDFIAALLGTLDVSFESITVSTGHRTVVAVNVSAEVQEKLVGPNGETLRALTMIARRMVEAKHGEEAATFLIDINGTQEAQLENVRQNARMLAQRARLFKHDVEMPPLNPYERLVVHELFADDKEIKTESAGEGKFRHIVLKFIA